MKDFIGKLYPIAKKTKLPASVRPMLLNTQNQRALYIYTLWS